VFLSAPPQRRWRRAAFPKKTLRSRKWTTTWTLRVKNGTLQLDMIDRSKRLYARFYRTQAGAEPVRVWLKALSAEDRKTIGKDVA
jgi:hypothetical protein